VTQFLACNDVQIVCIEFILSNVGSRPIEFSFSLGALESAAKGILDVKHSKPLEKSNSASTVCDIVSLRTHDLSVFLQARDLCLPALRVCVFVRESEQRFCIRRTSFENLENRTKLGDECF